MRNEKRGDCTGRTGDISRSFKTAFSQNRCTRFECAKVELLAPPFPLSHFVARMTERSRRRDSALSYRASEVGLLTTTTTFRIVEMTLSDRKTSLRAFGKTKNDARLLCSRNHSGPIIMSTSLHCSNDADAEATSFVRNRMAQFHSSPWPSLPAARPVDLCRRQALSISLCVDSTYLPTRFFC